MDSNDIQYGDLLIYGNFVAFDSGVADTFTHGHIHHDADVHPGTHGYAHPNADGDSDPHTHINSDEHRLARDSHPFPDSHHHWDEHAFTDPNVHGHAHVDANAHEHGDSHRRGDEYPYMDTVAHTQLYMVTFRDQYSHAFGYACRDVDGNDLADVHAHHDRDAIRDTIPNHDEHGVFNSHDDTVHDGDPDGYMDIVANRDNIQYRYAFGYANLLADGYGPIHAHTHRDADVHPGIHGYGDGYLDDVRDESHPVPDTHRYSDGFDYGDTYVAAFAHCYAHSHGDGNLDVDGFSYADSHGYRHFDKLSTSHQHHHAFFNSRPLTPDS